MDKEKYRRTFQFLLFMVFVFTGVGFAIYTDYHPELIPASEPKLTAGASIMIGKFSPYIIAGVVILFTIFKETIMEILKGVKGIIKK